MVNYQKELETVLASEAFQEGRKPKRLLLHACCAPCSSYVLEYLQAWFAITVFYYNPNITDREEYRKRAAEARRLTCIFNEKRAAYGGTQQPYLSKEPYPIEFLEGPYEPERFLAVAAGKETEPEGGSRCEGCFALRLSETAAQAAAGGYDYFTTTLTISPLKNADRLNRIGQEAAKKAGVLFLPSDFKKKDGYRRSVELSREYGLYRQDYCGCQFSRRQREQEKR